MDDFLRHRVLRVVDDFKRAVCSKSRGRLPQGLASRIRGRLGVVDDFLRHRALRVVDDFKRVVCSKSRGRLPQGKIRGRLPPGPASLLVDASESWTELLNMPHGLASKILRRSSTTQSCGRSPQATSAKSCGRLETGGVLKESWTTASGTGFKDSWTTRSRGRLPQAPSAVRVVDEYVPSFDPV